jgi:hypothetical protein
MSSNPSTKHKLFISYYHKDDEKYRNDFEECFGYLFINRCVKEGDIDTDNSDEYIKRLIREEYITDSSVIVVLVGAKTYCRKHVDWEIYAGLIKSGGYSGLLGLLLPTYPGYAKNEYDPKTVPPRLLANVDSEYASIYQYTRDESQIKKYIQWAFKRREHKKHLIDNSLLQFQKNRCD